jgi:hypothetical protein
MNSPYFLNAMDPGGDTGMILLSVQPERFELIEAATVEFRPDKGVHPVDTLVRWQREHPGDHRLVYESFHVTNQAGAAGIDLTALKVLEGLQEALKTRTLTYSSVTVQQPTQRKLQGTDDNLEKTGLHFGHKHAQRHVRDAARHAVTHLVRRSYRPLCELIAPRSQASRPAGGACSR